MDTKLFKTRTIIQSQTVNGQRAAIRKIQVENLISGLSGWILVILL